jgi:hypothetical protein
MSGRWRWPCQLALASVLLLASGGCAQTMPPGEAVPALRAHLVRIDQALADRRYGTARTLLEALVRTTADARATGRLTSEQADRILAAAARLAADLPEPSPRPGPTTSLRQSGKQEEDQKNDEHKHGEDKKDDGDSGGHDSGNGPDDGHGN